MHLLHLLQLRQRLLVPLLWQPDLLLELLQ
jgi:hypothetical protein